MGDVFVRGLLFTPDGISSRSVVFLFSGQYPEPPDGEATLWGTAPYGQDILPHMEARFTGTCRFRGGFSDDNRFTRPIVEDFLRGKHQAFPEDKSGSAKPPRNLLSTCSGRELSDRMSCPYGAVPQSVASPSGTKNFIFCEIIVLSENP